MPSLQSLKNFVAPIAPQVVGGLLNRRAAGQNTTTLLNGANAATKTLQSNDDDIQKLLAQIYGNNTKALAPYSSVGPPALNSLTAATAPGGSLVKPFTSADVNLEADPGYKFRLENGMKLLTRRQASGGSLSSGAALKAANNYAQDSASQEFDRAFNRDFATDQANKKTELDALMAQIGIGQHATDTTVQAGQSYGAQSVASKNLTAQQIAQLQTAKAEAEAAGNTAKANAISGILSGVSSAITDANDLKTLSALLHPATSAAIPAIPKALPALANTGGIAMSGAAGATPIASGLGGTSISAAGELIPTVPGVAIGSGSAGAAGTTAAAGTTGGGGLSSAVTGFMTNPITIGVGAAIVGITALLKSQAHHEANDLVKHFTNPFDTGMDKLNQSFATAAQSGQLTKADAQQIRQQVASLAQGYQAKLDEWKAKGGDKKKVATQAQATADKYYGSNFSNVLGWMDSVIGGLQA
jgi:hypothetical protein